MPLPSDEADLLGRTLQYSILYLFKRNRFAAYPPEEILFELGSFQPTPELLEAELKDLVALNG